MISILGKKKKHLPERPLNSLGNITKHQTASKTNLGQTSGDQVTTDIGVKQLLSRNTHMD